MCTTRGEHKLDEAGAISGVGRGRLFRQIFVPGLQTIGKTMLKCI